MADRHDYRLCRDGDCPRLACEAWREAYQEGYADGVSAGYSAGFAAGAASVS